MKKRLGLALAASLLLGGVPNTQASSVTIPLETPIVKHEMRAAWIASVVNIDWPSKPGLSMMQQKTEFLKLLDDVQAMGMNAIVMQIKPTADAFYPSQYGPWSKYLTGVAGKDPGYDPLAFMVEEAHKRNIEFHAWFNPYRITMPGAGSTDLNSLVESHPARQHPDWVVTYGQQLYYNPGIPEAQQFIIDGIMEVVKHYDIDAVHMDDYFYPYRIAGVDFPDQATYETYGADRFANKDDWRRDNVNNLVKKINETIKAEKPYVKFGISPFGVWRNIAKDPTGSNTTAGQTNYDDLFADTREWINKGYIDYMTPQIYWNIGFEPAAYDILLDWWAKEVRGKNVDLYIGQADYKINANNAAWTNPQEMPNQIKLNRTYPEVDGSMHFSLKDLNKNPLGIKDILMNDLYKPKALIPAMPWLDNEAPKTPKLRDAARTEEGIALNIEDHQLNQDVTYYAVYRFDGTKKGSTEDATKLLTTVRKTGAEQVFVDETADPHKAYTYVITSVDRIHNESKETREITIK